MDERLTCYICHQEGHEGILLLNQYICRSCELELTSISTDELKYESIRRNIKKIYKGVHWTRLHMESGISN